MKKINLARAGIHVSSFSKISKRLELPEGLYTFRYDYPLNEAAEFTHNLCGETSVVGILSLAAGDYEKIYDTVDEADGGEYGIWGHGLRDLYFEGITIDPVAKIVTFDIGS